MAKHARELQAYAKAAWGGSRKVLTDPGYSATEDAAFANAEQLIASGNTSEFGNTRWFLFMPMRVPVTVMLSIDVLPLGPLWHLSMSRPNTQKRSADRVPDMFAKRVLRTFFGTAEVIEGPPEGALKSVRHFRSPYCD